MHVPPLELDSTDPIEDIARLKFARKMNERSIGKSMPRGVGEKVRRDGRRGTAELERNLERPILHYHVRRAYQATHQRPLSTMTPSQVTSGAARVRGSLQA